MIRQGKGAARLPNPLIVCSCGCGELLRRFDEQGRSRIRILGHNIVNHRGARTGRLYAAAKTISRQRTPEREQITPGN